VDALLTEFERGCHDAGVSGRVLKVEGDPAEAICSEAQRVDLVVVGKKHLRDEDWNVSSHTLHSILRQSPRPVLCVPAADRDRRSVLVAYDGSLQAARALQLFVGSGLAANRGLHMLTVGDEGEEVSQKAFDFLMGHGFQAELHVAEGNHTADRILEMANHIQAGLIVMGTYGGTRFREFMFGSVTKAVLNRTTVPLFLYH
jgi:nucleotide-binding universal stress UspA family protein